MTIILSKDVSQLEMPPTAMTIANGDKEETIPTELNQETNHCSLRSSATQLMLTRTLPIQFGKIASNLLMLLLAQLLLAATGLKVKN